MAASCAATAEALSDQLEGELHGWRALLVARHLDRCSRCRQTLESLGRLARMLRGLGEVESL